MDGNEQHRPYYVRFNLLRNDTHITGAITGTISIAVQVECAEHTLPYTARISQLMNKSQVLQN
jgi:predicted DNA binding CopG/RHH family protein